MPAAQVVLDRKVYWCGPAGQGNPCRTECAAARMAQMNQSVIVGCTQVGPLPPVQYGTEPREQYAERLDDWLEG